MEENEVVVDSEVTVTPDPPEETGQEAPAISEEEQELLDSQSAEEAEEQEASDAADTQERIETEKKPWFQKRIDEMAKGRGDAERRADRLEALLAQQLERQQRPAQQPQQPAQPQYTRPKPTEESCEFDTARFVEELSDWKLEQHAAQSQIRARQFQQQQQQQAYQQTFATKQQETATEGAAKFSDYNDVVGSIPANVMHPILADRVFKTESPAEVAYYLGKNPDVAAKISRLDPVDMAIAVTRLEGKARIPAKEQATTKAPEPVKPVGKKTKAGAEPDPKSDPEGWLKWERARCRKLGKRY